MANISFTLRFWRQNGPKAEGHFDTREMKDIPDDTSFLDALNSAIEALRTDGTLKELSEKYFGQDISSEN